MRHALCVFAFRFFLDFSPLSAYLREKGELNPLPFLIIINLLEHIMKKNFRKDLLRSLHGEAFFSAGGFLIFAPRRRCPLMPYLGHNVPQNYVP